MFSYKEHYNSNFISKVRKSIYVEKGFYILKNFVNNKIISDINKRYLSKEVEYFFDDFHKNKDVNFSTPNYLIKKNNSDDITFCFNIWNETIDTQLNDLAIEAQVFRNTVEDRAKYFGINTNDNLILQYRLCRTVNPGIAVKRHADFVEEYRKDPTGCHKFDPLRCQLTLILSDFGSDYINGGFFFTGNDKKEFLFGKDVKVNSGDLIIWKYSNYHSVKNVFSVSKKGFSRIIFPQFDRFK